MRIVRVASCSEWELSVWELSGWQLRVDRGRTMGGKCWGEKLSSHGQDTEELEKCCEMNRDSLMRYPSF